MNESNPSRDAFARIIGTIGLAVGLTGLVFTYLNYQWERRDIISVRVYAARVTKEGPPPATLLEPHGIVRLEIVNMGKRPLYIRDFSISIGRSGTPYGGPSLVERASEEDKPLAPGRQTNYMLDWDFSKHPLIHWKRENARPTEDVWVHVETTRQSFDEPVTFIERSTSGGASASW